MKKRNFFYTERKQFKNIHEYLNICLSNHANNILFKFVKNGNSCAKRYKEVFDDILSLEAAFSEWNFEKKHIAILGKTSYEWIVSYLGVINAGYVAIPIDKLLPVEAIIEQLQFVDADCLLFDNDYYDVVLRIKESVDSIKYFVNFNEKAGNMLYLYDMLETPHKDTSLEILPDTAAEIVFSSGTTSNSKAIILTHENLASNVAYCSQVIDASVTDILLSILPNNHTYELTVGILTPIYFGATVCLNDSLKMMKRNLKAYKPTIMIVVPAVLEMMRKEILRAVANQNKNKKFGTAMKISKLLKKVNIDVSRKLFGEILEVLGGEFRTFVCGGAFLPVELIDFYTTIGITIIQGYGITECSPLVAANTDRNGEVGSVGKIGGGCSVKIVDNEIWVKGKNVMRGYYKNAEGTEACMENGWFKTGDLGYISKKGYLYITGRKKNLLVLSNGENVSPEELEGKLLELDYINEVIVFGEDDFIKAEIYPNYDLFDGRDIEEIEDVISKKIKEINSQLPMFKQIQKIKIRAIEFEKTTTNKIKRYGGKEL
ncbi:AMP-binding protein [Clostridium sp. BNL1100]|uniref:AMP-binding protein n=1 Tax=Clostridium sp. BNL1100 TaxID=755731 RepID=UPI00024A7998|nr:AMP-binding protein [Clostridium sp. BNL1100]AEY67420.1 AMP-forming long-chain acyl-CoA synthetase [Clostridium sp. BNL1100]